MKTFLILALVTCFLLLTGAAVVREKPKDSKMLSTYSSVVKDNHKIEAAANKATGKIAVGLLNGDSATAYTGQLEPNQTKATLTKDKTYKNSSDPDKVVITVLPNGDITVTAEKDNFDLTQDDLLASGACSNPSGTGACNEVNNDSDWWRCYRCCLILGCNG